MFSAELMRKRCYVWILVAGWALSAPFCSSAQGQDPAGEHRPDHDSDRVVQTVLDIAPADTAILLSAMNLDQMVDAVWESRAMNQLRESPAGAKMRKAWRKGRSSGFDQFGDNPFSNYLSFYQDTFGNPGFVVAWPFVEEILRKELFLFADENTLAWLEALSRIQTGTVKLAAEIDPEDEDPSAFMTGLSTLIAEEVKPLKSPVIVLGCVLEDPANYRGLLETAHGFLSEGIRQMPAELEFLAKGYDFAKTDRTLSLSFTIVGDRIPWDLLYAEAGEEGEPVLEAMENALAGKQFVVSILIQDHLMMLSLSPERETIENLKDGWLLADLPHMEVVRTARAAGHSLAAVAWSSERANRMGSISEGSLQSLPQVFELMLEEEFPEHPRNGDLVKEITGDLAEVEKRLSAMSQLGSDSVSVAWLSPQGIEGVSAQFPAESTLDDTRPLLVLENTGPAPALVFGSRASGQEQQFATVQFFMQRMFHYMEEYLPEYGGDEYEQNGRPMVTALKEGWEIAAEATSQQLIPATEGCSSSLVIDLTSKRNSWHPEMPDLGVAVPMPAMGVVMEIRDRERVLAAGEGYWKAASRVFDAIVKAADGELPLPPGVNKLSDLIIAKVTSSGDRQTIDLSLQSQIDGLGSFLSPQIVVEKDRVFMASLGDMNQRLAGKPATMFGPAGESQAAATVFFMDFNACVDASRSWLDYGIAAARAEGQSIEIRNEAESDQLDFSEAELMESATALQQFLKCFRGISAATRKEKDAVVSRFLFHFADLPADAGEEGSGDASGEGDK